MHGVDHRRVRMQRVHGDELLVFARNVPDDFLSKSGDGGDEFGRQRRGDLLDDE